MRRRDLLLLGGATVAWPLFARAQHSSQRWRVGMLNCSRADAERVRLWDVFRQRLRELGYVDGVNISFELRWADGKAERLPALAAELVKLKVDVIATTACRTVDGLSTRLEPGGRRAPEHVVPFSRGEPCH